MATVRQLRDANSQGAVPPTRQRRYVSAVRLHATGVAGYIGCRHARRLVGDGHEVLGIDNLNQCYDGRLKLDRLRELGVVTTETRSEGTGPVDANDSRLRVLRLDLVDQERVLALFRQGRVRRRVPLGGTRRSVVVPKRTTCTGLGYAPPARSTCWTASSRSGRAARRTIS